MGDTDPDRLRDLYIMVGMITLGWARVENTLTRIIGVINYYAGPFKGYDEPPVAMKRKLVFLRLALRQVPVFHILQDDGRALTGRLGALAHRRNDLVHNAAWELEDGNHQLVAITVRSGQYAVEYHRFSQADAVRLNAEIAELHQDAEVFFDRVCKVFS